MAFGALHTQAATSAPSPNRLILPRIRSETRGWVTPKSLVACAWLMPVRARWFFSAIIRTERSFMFSASCGVSSMASQTLANCWPVMGCCFAFAFIRFNLTLRMLVYIGDGI